MTQIPALIVGDLSQQHSRPTATLAVPVGLAMVNIALVLWLRREMASPQPHGSE
jgi:hypothetical protein